jgi:hypothetical protein
VQLLDAIFAEVIEQLRGKILDLRRMRQSGYSVSGLCIDSNCHYLNWTEVSLEKRNGRLLPALIYYLYFDQERVYSCIHDFPGKTFYYADPKFPENLYQSLMPDERRSKSSSRTARRVRKTPQEKG